MSVLRRPIQEGSRPSRLEGFPLGDKIPRMKPDYLAPGMGVLGAIPGGAVLFAESWDVGRLTIYCWCRCVSSVCSSESRNISEKPGHGPPVSE